MISQPLSNIQKELLKLYSTNLSKKELMEIKSLLGKHFARKAVSKADETWDKKNYSDNKMDEWLNEG